MLRSVLGLSCALAACSGSTNDDGSDDDVILGRDGGSSVVTPRDAGADRDASTNPPLTSMRVLLGTRDMLGRAAPLDVGRRFVGDREAATPFTIRNESPNMLTLNASTPVSLAGDSGEFLVTTPASTTLGPGEATTFTVEFAPTRPGPAQVDVRVHHADGAIGASAFTMRGYGHATGGQPLYLGGGGAYYRLRTPSGEPNTWEQQTDRLDTSLCDGLGPDHPRDLIRGFGYGDGTFVVAGGSCDGMLGMTRDGVNWTTQILGMPYAGFYQDVAWQEGLFVAVGGLGGRAYSNDRAASWVVTGDYSKCQLRRVAAGNGRFVAVGNLFDRGCITTTTDGETWTPITDEPDLLDSVAFGNGVFVAIGPTRCQWSEDGLTWNTCTGQVQSTRKVFFANGEFLVFGPEGVSRSVDGNAWTTAPGPWLEGVAYGQGRYVGVAVQMRGYGTTVEGMTLENVPSDVAEWHFGYVYP